jgi:hypothetical protein
MIITRKNTHIIITKVLDKFIKIMLKRCSRIPTDTIMITHRMINNSLEIIIIKMETVTKTIINQTSKTRIILRRIINKIITIITIILRIINTEKNKETSKRIILKVRI